MAAGDLTTVANLKAWLGITGSTDDALLARLVTAASQWVQNWLSRDLLSAARSEVRNGTGSATMVLANRPVTAVASLMINGQAVPASSGHSQPGYFFSDSTLFLRGYTFTRGQGNVTVSYTAGYASIPPELEQACIELISVRYRERDRIGHVSKSLGGETVTFSQKDAPDSVITILKQYESVVPL